MTPAVVLLSGGLDSATTLALATQQGFACHALSFSYGQRHVVELEAARRVASSLGVVEHRTMGINLAGIGGSALTDDTIAVPEAPSEGIPVTYVPARNTIFLAMALGWAEVLGARDIFIGVNARRLFRLSRLPAGVHSRLRRDGQPCDQGGGRGLAIHHSHSADRLFQSGNHQRGSGGRG